MLSFNDVLAMVGMYPGQLVAALKHDGFPLPTVNSGREEWHETEVRAWVDQRAKLLRVGDLRP